MPMKRLRTVCGHVLSGLGPHAAASPQAPVVAVHASFNYPRRGKNGEHPKTNKTGDEDPDKETMVSEEVVVPVHDARQMPAPPSLDHQGFALVPHTTSVDFSDEEAIRATYYKEIEDLVREHTGAERCVLFDHTIRKVEKPGTAKGFGTAAPGGFVTSAVNKVHGDYTVEGAPRRVVGLSKPTESGTYGDEPPLTPEESDEIVRGDRRFAIVNVWRSISREAPVKRMPLAVVDCTSVNEAEDLFAVDLIFKDRVGENLALDEKPYHRWYYFPEMEFNEAMLFKTMDSSSSPEVTGHATIHSAFDDPRTNPGDPTRESIEVRVLAIYPKDSSCTNHKAEVMSERCCNLGGDHS